LSVELKAISGNNDRGGGLVWRYRDSGNYYVTRFNPLEDNFRVYHVVNGQRTQLANADVKLTPDQWHTVRVVQRGDHIQCHLDGKLLICVHDATIRGAGAIGLCSNSDPVICFDSLALNPPPME